MADEAEQMAMHLKIQGKVQRVWYRQWLVDQARSRGIRGWVRNRSDGSVEAVLSGEMSAVRALVQACHQGPPKAQVSRIVQIPGEYRPTEEDFPEEFHQLPTL
jgi:acylphosphatase